MPDRAPYEILAYSPPTPQILPKNQIPINSHPPVDGFTIPDIRERILSDDLSILSFPWSVQIAFFAKINFDETVPDKLFDSLSEAGQCLFLQPVLAVGNSMRGRSDPKLLAEAIEPYYGISCFEFKFGEIPYPEHPPKSPSTYLPLVAFMLPGSLDVSAWNQTRPLDIDVPEIRSMVAVSILHSGRDIIFTDSTASVVLNATQPKELQYTAFPDLKTHPIRLVVASLLKSKCERGHYFTLPYEPSRSFTTPSGALNHPSERSISDEDAMRLWSQKSDIDWYTACNDAEYRAVVSRWMQNNLSTFQGKPFLSPGDVLQVDTFAFSARSQHLHLEPIYPKEPLPSETASYLERTRRNTEDRSLKTRLSEVERFAIRILDEIDSSNVEDGSSFACEIVTTQDVPWTGKTKLRVKIFDDRRMGDQEIVAEGPDDRQWFCHANGTHSDTLVALEDAIYHRLDHAQGSVMPYYYGAHEILLPDGVRCWAILTELVEGATPQSLPRDYPPHLKTSVAVGLRHALRVLQYAEVSKPLWRFGDIRIRFSRGLSDGASVEAFCTIINFRQAKFSTLHGWNEATDDYLELWQILTLTFGEYITSQNMGDREPWDFYTWYTNEYIGIEWRPGDYDDDLYKNPSEEDPRMYRPGGYHPVRIGETYDGRYLVVRKLGWGVQSTVWLARDLRSSSYVALKMLQSKRIAAMEETEVLDILAQDTFAWNHVGERRGMFVHEGPYGRHPCIVFEVLGSTVRDLVKVRPQQALSTAQVKIVAKQLLLALRCCHDQGIIHTDIKHSNLMLSLPEIESYLDRTDEGGVPSATDDRHDGKRYYPLDSKPIKTSIPDDFVIKLVDFGSAQKADGTTALWPIQPQLLRAPEVILDGGWGTPADIWNFACLIYELYSGQILFESPQQTEIPPIYIQLAQMQSICGSFPDELLRKGRLTSRYFDPETGEVDGLFISPLPMKGFVQSWMKGLHGATEAEVDLFEDFMSTMLKLDPDSRPSASELLQHPWLSS